MKNKRVHLDSYMKWKQCLMVLFCIMVGFVYGNVIVNQDKPMTVFAASNSSSVKKNIKKLKGKATVESATWENNKVTIKLKYSTQKQKKSTYKKISKKVRKQFRKMTYQIQISNSKSFDTKYKYTCYSKKQKGLALDGTVNGVNTKSFSVRVKNILTSKQILNYYRGETVKLYVRVRPYISKSKKGKWSDTVTVVLEEENKEEYIPDDAIGTYVSIYDDINAAELKDDGTATYNVGLSTDYGMDWFKDVKVVVENVTPPKWKGMYTENICKQLQIVPNSIAISDYKFESVAKGLAKADHAYNKMTFNITVSMDVMCIKVSVYKDGVEIPLRIGLGHHEEEAIIWWWCTDDSPKALEFYSIIRKQIEDELWTDDMSKSMKLSVIGDYLRSITYYYYEQYPNIEDWEYKGTEPVLGHFLGLAIRRSQGYHGTCYTVLDLRYYAADLGIPLVTYEEGIAGKIEGEYVPGIEQKECIYFGTKENSSNPTEGYDHITMYYNTAETMECGMYTEDGPPVYYIGYKTCGYDVQGNIDSTQVTGTQIVLK